MAYTLTFTHKNGYLLAETSGEICTFDEFSEKAQSVVREAMESGLHRVLLDERNLNVAIDTFDSLRVAQDFEKDDIQIYGGRLACLCHNECVNIYKTFETLYQNRSLSYHLFDDIPTAIAWLTE